ncbi:thioesterase family protein [Arthrobacter sp. VKM Ac-2550]|uniref:thioesterase family protein n=1 Tax=Crystallibacter permensis TaxID=1938888 RepID=UPI0022260A4A|nr:thioesterase family protein [Arthrobacter sp. VKM Ac-2550]MCW2134385.1 acyl-CoA thioester hydrolase [Arthrobacter sp. VKM Ac-2550]
MNRAAAGELAAYRCTVLPEWIDYNGHMSEAFYVLAFGFATDHVMDQLGLDEPYRKQTGNSLYTVEAHVRYLAETGLGAELEITTAIAGSGPKKLHLAHEMHAGGRLIATEELLALHVNQQSGRSEAFPAAITGNIDAFGRAAGPAPDWIGRKVSA